MLKQISRWLSNTWYWLRTHTYNRYHIVDCRSPQNGYDWGWCDRDWLMFCACFNILCDFVEKELPHSSTDYETPGPWCDAKKELEQLYAWWIADRAAEHAALAEVAKAFIWEIPLEMTPEKRAHFDKREALDAKDELMLERLMRVRGFMWT